MGLADIARAKQIQKQLDRLQSVQDAEERDRHAYKFATYQGKDPVDGTDIVAVDGVKTSGFRLMSNAPLEIGDRVNLRPNQQGLQRVDAKNVAIIKEPIIEVIKKSVPYTIIWGLNTVRFAFYDDNGGASVTDSGATFISYDTKGDIDLLNSSTNISDTKQLFPDYSEYQYLYGSLDFDIEASTRGVYGFQNTNLDTGTINLSFGNALYVKRLDDPSAPYTKKFDIDLEIEVYVSVDNGSTFTLDTSATYNFAITTPTSSLPLISDTEIFSNTDYSGSQFKWYLRYRKSGGSSWYTL